MIQTKQQLPNLLKWAGSKDYPAFIDKITPIWQQHKHCRLVELFCGAANVAINLQPENALLFDINPDLINFLRWVRDSGKITVDFINEESAYYEVRSRFNLRGIKHEERAQYFYYMNRTGYRGLCRYNLTGGFNSPYGRYPTVPYLESFWEFKKLFRHWHFVATDYRNAVRLIQPEDFLYIDPPYDGGGFTEYFGKKFTWDDQLMLAKIASRHKGVVVASNLATDRIIEVYSSLGFEIDYVDAPRSINGDRGTVKEMFAMRNV